MRSNAVLYLFVQGRGIGLALSKKINDGGMLVLARIIAMRGQFLYEEMLCNSRHATAFKTYMYAQGKHRTGD